MRTNNSVEEVRSTDDRRQIREKRWLWNLMPFAGRKKFASTLGYRTYLPPSRYALWMKPVVRQSVKDLVRHEHVHVQQWHEFRWGYVFRYVFSRKHRLAFEVAAYAEQCYLNLNRIERRAAKYAKWLSSWRYGWLGGQEEIAARICLYAHSLRAVREK